MKIKISILVFLFYTATFFGQKRNLEIDSLHNVIKKTTKTSDKASAHSRLAWLLILNDISIAKAHIDSSLVLYTEIKDKKGIAATNYKYGVLFRVSGNYKASLEYINKYQLYVESQQDTLAIANSMYQKGVVYSLQGDYKQSLKEYYKILSIYETLKDSTSMGFTLNSIGIVYKNLKKYPQAIENYQKAIAIHEKLNDKNNLANVYNSLGSVYAEQKRHDDAIKYFEKALAIDIETKNNWGISIANLDIGTLFLDKKEYKKALVYFKNAYKIQKKENFDAEIAETESKLAFIYTNLGDLKKSEFFFKMSLQNEIKSKRVRQDIYYHASQFYEKVGDYQKALSHYKEYANTKDSIFNGENLKSINLLQTQFETEKKDKEIIQQQLQLQKTEKELQKKKTQTNYLMGIASFLLVASILAWFLFQQRQKHKNQEIVTLKREHQIKTLETLIEGEEKERFRIAKELHDGVNGDLSAIKYKLSTLLEMNNTVIKEAITMIDNSCNQVRAISHNLVPPSLENFNLLEAVEEYCEKSDDSHSQKITFQHLGDEVNMSKKEEINIFRIIQELVTNSIKHAEATKIDVQISCRNKIMQITVEDNGKGFDTNTIEGRGIGLKNIQSRVDYLQATLDLISNKQGTSTTIEIDKN